MYKSDQYRDQVIKFKSNFFTEKKYLYRPAEGITYYGALEFCKWLGAKEKCYYRLPSRLEWEYVAIGGLLSKGFKYTGSNNIDEVAWHKYNSKGETQRVGEKLPNELGVYDLLGNVSEMCNDTCRQCEKAVLKNDVQIIIKGGSYHFLRRCTITSWQCGSLNSGATGVGFRIVKEIEAL